MLRVDKLEVAYDQIQVIWDLSLRVAENEAVGIFGPNGAGKTTLIKAIMGLVRARKGEILYSEEPLTGLETHRIAQLGIALVPQQRELFPLMTVKENLRLGAAYISRARNLTGQNLGFVYQLFPILKEREKQPAGTLSGGQQRMLAVGRALMSSPRLLILDEPSVGLQPSLVSELFHKLNEIKREDVSILLAEQNVRQGLKVIDRGYVMENGQIVMEDDAGSLSGNEHIKRAYLGI